MEITFFIPVLVTLVDDVAIAQSNMSIDNRNNGDTRAGSPSENTCSYTGSPATF